MYVFFVHVYCAGVVYVFWICVLSFQTCIVLNGAVFWLCVLYFGYMYRVLGIRYMHCVLNNTYCVLDTCIVI